MGFNLIFIFLTIFLLNSSIYKDIFILLYFILCILISHTYVPPIWNGPYVCHPLRGKYSTHNFILFLPPVLFPSSNFAGLLRLCRDQKCLFCRRLSQIRDIHCLKYGFCFVLIKLLSCAYFPDLLSLISFLKFTFRLDYSCRKPAGLVQNIYPWLDLVSTGVLCKCNVD